MTSPAIQQPGGWAKPVLAMSHQSLRLDRFTTFPLAIPTPAAWFLRWKKHMRTTLWGHLFCTCSWLRFMLNLHWIFHPDPSGSKPLEKSPRHWEQSLQEFTVPVACGLLCFLLCFLRMDGVCANPWSMSATRASGLLNDFSPKSWTVSFREHRTRTRIFC